jgi:hypothetical protein
MKRLLPLIASLALLAVPATAAAATSHGVVLSVSSKTHRIQLVDTRHVVRAYQYRASPRGLGLGSRVSFRAAGSTITDLTSSGARAHRFSFLATVVRSNSAAIIVRLGDGRAMSLATRHVLALGETTVYALRNWALIAVAAATAPAVEPGLVVLVTATIGNDGTSVSIKPAPASSAGVSGERRVSGVVTAVGSSSLTIRTSAGEVSLQMSAAKLAAAGVQTCDVVAVKFHQHGSALVADGVSETGTSSTGSCSGQAGTSGSGGSGDTSGDGPDAIGNITTISASGLTIDVPGQGSMSFVVDDPSITEGYLVGDQVDVTFTQDSDGKLDASDVEYVENDSVGTVVTVTPTSLTINAPSGEPSSFTDNSGDDLFEGINPHDTVDVSYHLSNGQPVVDEVVDETDDGS